jgi:hypothetical protein
LGSPRWWGCSQSDLQDGDPIACTLGEHVDRHRQRFGIFMSEFMHLVEILDHDVCCAARHCTLLNQQAVFDIGEEHLSGHGTAPITRTPRGARPLSLTMFVPALTNLRQSNQRPRPESANDPRHELWSQRHLRAPRPAPAPKIPSWPSPSGVRCKVSRLGAGEGDRDHRIVDCRARLKRRVRMVLDGLCGETILLRFIFSVPA